MIQWYQLVLLLLLSTQSLLSNWWPVGRDRQNKTGKGVEAERKVSLHLWGRLNLCLLMTCWLSPSPPALVLGCDVGGMSWSDRNSSQYQLSELPSWDLSRGCFPVPEASICPLTVLPVLLQGPCESSTVGGGGSKSLLSCSTFQSSAYLNRTAEGIKRNLLLLCLSFFSNIPYFMPLLFTSECSGLQEVLDFYAMLLPDCLVGWYISVFWGAVLLVTGEISLLWSWRARSAGLHLQRGKEL